MHDNLTEALFEEPALLQEEEAPHCKIPTTYRHVTNLSTNVDEGSGDLCIDQAGLLCMSPCPIAKCGCLQDNCMQMHGTCIQEMIYMCCVQVQNHPRAIRRWWVKQPLKGAMNGFATSNRLTAIVLSMIAVSYIKLALVKP